MKSFDNRDTWTEGFLDDKYSFVGFVQWFSEKTARSVKGTVLISYAFHAELLNATIATRNWLIDNGPTLVGFCTCLLRR